MMWDFILRLFVAGILGAVVGNYADVPAVSKWFLSFLMMVGRLEIFTVLTILLPGFWKQ